jgi:hypothetical protein
MLAAFHHPGRAENGVTIPLLRISSVRISSTISKAVLLAAVVAET